MDGFAKSESALNFQNTTHNSLPESIIPLTFIAEFVDLGAHDLLPQLNDEVTVTGVVLPPATVLVRHICRNTGQRSRSAGETRSDASQLRSGKRVRG